MSIEHTKKGFYSFLFRQSVECETKRMEFFIQHFVWFAIEITEACIKLRMNMHDL
jgi:hypothetical protein